MLIGLLEAETLPDKVIKEFGSYGNMFVRLLSADNPDFRFRYYQADQGQLPANIDECDAYIITGSRHNAYDTDPWIENLKTFVREIDTAKKKCLGVCFGHQLIAEALGGKVERSEKGWGIGVAEFNIREPLPLMADIGNKFEILVSHQDQVTKLPRSALHLASSNFCPFGAYTVGNHLLSMQGHPEFTPDYLTRLITKRREIIGPGKADKALNLMGLFRPNTKLVKLITAFLTQIQKVTQK